MRSLSRPPSTPSRPSRVLGLLAAASLLALAACSGVPSGGEKTASGGVRTKLDGWGPQTPPSGFPRFVDHSVGQEEISMQAMGLVGVPYRWGGNTPAAGFDCSGLVRYVVERAARVDLPRTTGDMSREGVAIDPSEVAPGDLIFFNTSGRAHSHVGVYVGDYRFVNAPSTGGTVRIDYVTNPYWAKRFDGIRRVAGPGRPPILDTPIAPQAPQSIMPPRALAAAEPMVPPAAAVPITPTAPVYSMPPTPGGAGVAAAGVGVVGAAAVAAKTSAGSANTASESAPAGNADPIAAAILRSDRSANSADTPRADQRIDARTAAISNSDDDPISRIVNRGY